MDISKKELICTLFVDIILLMIVVASIVILKASFVCLAIASVSTIFICISMVMTWIMMREKRIDVEHNK